MDFKTLRKEIIEKSKLDFVTASTQLEELVFKCTKDCTLSNKSAQLDLQLSCGF